MENNRNNETNNQQPTPPATDLSKSTTSESNGQPAAPDVVGSSESDGKRLGMIGLIVSLASIPLNFFLFGSLAVIGFVLSFIGRRRSRKAGVKNKRAVAGVIISSITAIITLVLYVIIVAAVYTVAQRSCDMLGAGSHRITIEGDPQIVNGPAIITCSENGQLTNIETADV